jgi:hypothetical protein
VTLVRLYFAASLLLSVAGFVACRELAGEGHALWAVAQWCFALLALANVGLLWVNRGGDETSEE